MSAPVVTSGIDPKNKKLQLVSLLKEEPSKKTYSRAQTMQSIQNRLFAVTHSSYRCGSGCEAGDSGDRVVVVVVAALCQSRL